MCDYSAYAIIGMRIRKANLYDRVPNDKCEYGHKLPGCVNFCPECGRKVQRMIEVPRSFYDSKNKEVAGYAVLDNICEENWFIVVHRVCTDNPDKACKLMIKEVFPDIHKIWDEMKGKLEPLGLWNPHSFGIWANLLIC